MEETAHDATRALPEVRCPCPDHRDDFCAEWQLENSSCPCPNHRGDACPTTQFDGGDDGAR